MSAILAVTLSLVAARAASLLELTLILRWQAHRENGRQQHLLTLAAHLPPKSGIDIDDLRADGSRMRLRVTTPHDPDQESHGPT
jgi:hypothetical protein